MSDPAENEEALKARFSSIKHTILVLSGKGGVGKSTFSVQLALSLVRAGKRVGLLDVDLCGPSIPGMLGLRGQGVHQCASGWVPVFADKTQRLSVMSIAFLLGGEDDPVVWRGPKKTAMIRQFLSEVYWGEIDYLIVDTPPGTSDEHISVVESLRAVSPDGAVLVTTPQGVSLADVARELNFCKRAKLPVLGVVENMSGFVCPHCTECTNIFSAGGGASLAEKYSVPFLGNIPLEPKLTESLEKGTSFIDAYPESVAAVHVGNIVAKLCGKVQ